MNLEKGKMVIMKGVGYPPFGGPLQKTGSIVSLVVWNFLTNSEQKVIAKNRSDIYLQAIILDEMDSIIYQAVDGYYMVGYN